jgi:protein CrcB
VHTEIELMLLIASSKQPRTSPSYCSNYCLSQLVNSSRQGKKFTAFTLILRNWSSSVRCSFLAEITALSPERRLFIITGFLGGLITFSTFSAETITLLARGQYAWSDATIATHLGGSLLITVLRMQIFKGLH